MKRLLRQLPGWIGTGIITFLNAIWLYWGFGEAFFEGWGVPETPWFLFLAIGVAAIILSFIAIKYPFVGGGILIVAGLGFATWWLVPAIKNGFYTLSVLFERLLLSAGFSIVGGLFILDGWLNSQAEKPGKPWILQNSRLVLAIGIPLIAAIVVSAINLPIVLTRIDDGIRTARRIDGTSGSLIWAPAGPGWNWKQDFGGYPSWDSLATYGIEPIGLDSEKLNGAHAIARDMENFNLCVFLSENGMSLLSDPQNIWRFPTVDEIAGSLSQNNQNAGCKWNGETGKLKCKLSPDKETPLWAPDEPPVYYWAADSYDYESAYFVSYSGWVSRQPKNWGNPRHGYRCVKNP